MIPVVLSLLLPLLHWTSAFPSGAPSTACISMYPQHPGPNGPVSAQGGLTVPFQIEVTEQDGGRSYKIRVVRNSNFAGAPSLNGFFLQVRDVNGEIPLGEFADLPAYARIAECENAHTITHKDNMPKPIDQGLEFSWLPKALQTNTKNIQVLGTFVQNLQTFWVKVPSRIVAVNQQASSSGPTIGVDTQNNSQADSQNGNSGQVNTQQSNTNDRKPGFGNSGAVQPQGSPSHVNGHNNGVAALFAGVSSIFATAFVMLF